MNKKTVVVMFGGQSSEHEVSRVSAATIISSMHEEKYNVLPLGITKEGKWLLYDGSVEHIKNGTWENHAEPVILSPDATHKGLLKLTKDQAEWIPIDVVYPVFHGKFGEDGAIQGLLEIAGIPYVGCGVLSSAVSMNKYYTKIIASHFGICQAQYIGVHKHEKNNDEIILKIENEIGYPNFIKPANAGSSVGITKAHNKEELLKGLSAASIHDSLMIVEEHIEGRELECAVLGGRNPQASCVGEVIPAGEFYTYDAKYNNAESKTMIPADLPEGVVIEIKKAAIKVFQAVDGFGLARVDFFLRKSDNQVIFNEINTLPGHTPISMYPSLWEYEGKPLSLVIDELIQLALERNVW